MKKGKHIHTDFIKFLLEKHSEIKNQDEELETPELEEEDEDEEGEDEDEIEEEDKDNKNQDENEEEDEIIEKLLNEYKKVKKQYENNRVQIRRKK